MAETENMEYHLDVAPLLEILNGSGKNYDIQKITDAYNYAKELHEGQFRASGEPYITHPLAVAEIVAGLGLDTESICAALLHDTVEDCSDKTSLAEIEKRFGKTIAELVDGLTKIQNFAVEDKQEQTIENMRKIVLAMSRDVRVIFVKLCDRLHNMRTLFGKKDDAKRRSTALETMQIYAPLAHRLGMQRVKSELESLCLLHLDPIGYEDIRTRLEKTFGQNENFIENIKKEISDILQAEKIDFRLKGREKTVYSVYRKVYKLHKDFDNIFDFYAVRVIVDSIADCYSVLGLIHSRFHLIPGRFKDYISTPKPNYYRSLHTTVIGKDGIPFEVQIRTEEMDQFAEYGLAAHWKYKSGESSDADLDKKLEWISKLVETEASENNPEDFIDAFKTDLYHDEVFAFTPKGDILSLPSGANVIDFAYAVHSGVGDRLTGAKANGAIVPLDYQLQNGDVVEILTSNSAKGPSRDWLNIVKTGSARAKIRNWFKREKREENIVIGKGIYENELKRTGKSITDKDRAEVALMLTDRAGFNNVDDFYNALGYGGVLISKYAQKIREECEKRNKAIAPDEIPELNKKLTKPKKVKSDGGIVVDGESGCMVKFAKCCNPLPGDPVVGFVTIGFGVSIHKQDCPNMEKARQNSEMASRLKPAHWDLPKGGHKDVYEAVLRISVSDRIGILADITAVFADMRVSILALNAIPVKNGEGNIVDLKIGCRDIDHYNSIVNRLRMLPGVESITRGYTI